MSGKLLEGRYQIVQVLSAGGFCQTYLAQDISLPDHRTCVVKHMFPATNHPDALPTFRRLFTREAEALEKLVKYDWVPQLLAHFEQNQQFYLVQEFIAGHSLKAELQPGQIWTESQVVELLQEVLSILEFVHSHGMIHRDIKPSNLIRRHQDGRLVLIGFGSVKQAWTQVVTAQGQTNSTFAIGIPATIAIGTTGYMPVEQGRGRPRPNSDIYALGMIGIQALTGLNPTQLLEDADTGEIIWQHQTQVSPGLACVLNKMVRYNFKDRYQSVMEVLQALQSLTTYLPTHTAPVQLSVTTKPLPQAQLSRQGTIPVVSGLPLKARSQTHLSAKRSDAVPSSAHKSGLLLGMTIITSVALIGGSYYFLRSQSVRYAQSPVPAPQVQQKSVAIQTPNNALENISLAKTLSGHSDSVWSVALSPDGQTLVSGSQDQTIKLWHLDTGKLLRTLAGHSQAVWSIALSPDGKTLASGSSDNTIKLWNLSSGKLLRTLAGHSQAVRSIALSPDGQTLVSGSSDNTIKLWNLSSGKLLRTFFGHTNRVISVALSPDGQILASGSVDKTIKIWKLSSGKLLYTLSRNSDWGNSIAISPDGRTVVGGIGDIIKIWNLNTGELLHTLSGHSSDITSISLSANGKQLVSGSRDKTIKIWQLSTASRRQ